MNTYKKKRRRKKSKVPQEVISPDQQMLFDELVEVCRKLGIEVKIESGRFEGGNCMLKGSEYIYLNKNHLMDQKIEVLISNLRTMDLENVFIPPKVRSCLGKDEIAIRG